MKATRHTAIARRHFDIRVLFFFFDYGTTGRALDIWHLVVGSGAHFQDGILRHVRVQHIPRKFDRFPCLVDWLHSVDTLR